MHRLYYHESKDAFYFAAEAKAILEVRPELRTLDPSGPRGVRFLRLRPGEPDAVRPDSRACPALRPGPSATAASSAGARTSSRSEWEQQAPLDPESYYRELRDVFSRNLPRYFNGHERIGVALTGGMDTRVIMAWRKAAPASLPCYTFGSMFRDNQDVLVARRVARECEQAHHVVQTGPDFLSRFAHYAERSMYLTDGCIDLTRAPDLYVSEQAREIAPVKIVGTYGSEVLTLVPTFKPMKPLVGLFSPQLMDEIQRAGVTYTALRQEHPLTFAAFRQSPWSHYGVLSLEQTQLSVRSPYLDNDFIRTVYRAPQSAGANGDVRLRLISEGNPALARIRTDRGLGGDSGPLSATVSRMLLDFSYKAEYAYDYGMPQWLAAIDHRFSALHLERLFLGRHKMFHFRIWYRDVLSQYVREILLDSRSLSRPYIERNAVEALVERHVKGDRNHTSEIHKLLTLELIHRQFIDPR